MKTNLEIIREKVIEAVPDIREHYGRCMGCGYGIEYCKKGKTCPLTYRDREIRLSDVLVAMGNKRKRMVCDPSFKYPGVINIFPAPDAALRSIPEPTYCRWNGLEDDLREQPEETLEFLAKLLK